MALQVYMIRYGMLFGRWFSSISTYSICEMFTISMVKKKKKKKKKKKNNEKSKTWFLMKMKCFILFTTEIA